MVKKEVEKGKHVCKLVILPIAFILFIALFKLGKAQYEQQYEDISKYTKNSNAIDVLWLKYEPFPVEPGEKFKIYLLVKNVGTDKAANATCKIVNRFPFFVYGESQKSIGELAAGREWQMDFVVKVDENAIEGVDELDVYCTNDPKADAWLVKKIPIKIQYRYSIINIVDVKSEPEYFGLGEKGKVVLTITNNAENTIQDVVITLNLENTPFAPANGINVKKLKNLNRGQVADIIFEVYAMPNAEANFYKIPMEINYTDVGGNKNSFTTYITLKIAEMPRYYVVVDSIDTKTNEIFLKFVNNGAIDLKYFSVKILDAKGLDLKTSEIYIGDFDSDDYYIENFVAKIKKNKVEIPLQINYRDAVGRQYNDFINVSLDVSKVLNKAKPSHWPLLILILVVLLVGFYFYKKRKDRKK